MYSKITKSIIVFYLLLNCNNLQSQNTWNQKANLPSGGANGLSFSIGDKGYFIASNSKNLWEYNPLTNTWTQKKDFKGDTRSGAVAFSIRNKGYVGFGQKQDLSKAKDFWEYDPTNDKWTQKANIPFSGRNYALGFCIENKGYVGTGIDSTGFRKDFWEYNPEIDSWSRKADFGGSERMLASGFSIGSSGYIGLGFSPVGPGLKKDFWEYDRNLNQWTRKADFAGDARYQSLGLSIINKGYIGTGSGKDSICNDFWEYDPITDVWALKANFAGPKRKQAIGLNIGDKGYIGFGANDLEEQLVDFWEYNPSTSSVSNSLINYLGIVQCYPNPNNGIFKVATLNFNCNLNIEIYDCFGSLIFKSTIVNELMEIALTGFSNGIYTIKTLDKNNVVSTHKIIKQ